MTKGYLLTALTLGALVLAGCGAKTDDSAASTSTPSGTTGTQATSTPAAEGSKAGMKPQAASDFGQVGGDVQVGTKASGGK